MTRRCLLFVAVCPGPLCDGPEVLLSFGQIEEAILHGILKPKTRLQARAFKSKYYVVMINHKNKIRIYEGLASFLELTNSQQEVLKQLSYYRVSQLNLLQIKRLLCHQNALLSHKNGICIFLRSGILT